MTRSPRTRRLAAAVALPALTVLAAVAALPLVPAPAAAQRAMLERIIKRRVLGNGLEVITVENHGVPIATVEINVKNGAYTQSPEYAGLAHMYEHMFFKASERYPDPDSFINRAAELGAIFNGTTQEETVSYYLTLPSDSLEGGMSFMASSLRAPLFRADELAREKEVVLGEYDRNEASPGFAFSNAATRLLYPGNFSRKNTIGDRQVIRTVTPEKMRFIQHKYYIPNNSALVVTGDVNPDSVFRWAERFYGDWARGPDPFVADPIPPIPALPRNEAVVSEGAVSAVLVQLQWQGPSVRQDPEATYAADVFSDALNAANSAFQKRLVDSGLWQGVAVNYYTLNQKGPITVQGQTTADKLRPALAALQAELQKVGEPGYFTAEQLRQVKAQRATQTEFGIERTSGLTHTIGFWWSVASLEYFMGYEDNMAAQTPEQLRAYARRYILGQPHVIGVLLSPQDQATLHLTTAELLGGAQP